MARPVKEGLDYFPLYVDIFEDEKIEAVSGEFGIKGEIIIIKLLCAIYKKGYFILWNDLIIAQMLKRLPGISKDLLNDVVERLVLWEFFDKDLFHSAGILTNETIQENFFEATKRRKSPKPTLYVLDKFLDHENLIKNDLEGVNVNINQQREEVNVNINPQSKVKESKVNVLTPPLLNNIDIWAKHAKNQNSGDGDKKNLMQKIIKLYQYTGFGIVTPLTKDTLESFIEIYPYTWIEEAFHIAGDGGKLNLNYIKAILNRWKTNGKNSLHKNYSKKTYNPTTEKYTNEELEEIGKAKTDKLLEEMDNGR